MFVFLHKKKTAKAGLLWMNLGQIFHRKEVAHRINVQVIAIKQPIRVYAKITEEARNFVYNMSLQWVADDWHWRNDDDVLMMMMMIVYKI